MYVRSQNGFFVSTTDLKFWTQTDLIRSVVQSVDYNTDSAVHRSVFSGSISHPAEYGPEHRSLLVQDYWLIEIAGLETGLSVDMLRYPTMQHSHGMTRYHYRGMLVASSFRYVSLLPFPPQAGCVQLSMRPPAMFGVWLCNEAMLDSRPQARFFLFFCDFR